MKIRTLITTLLLMLLSIGAYAAATKVPYVIVKDGTATFYFTDNKPDGALQLQSEDVWDLTTRESITKVVFDDSFKDFEPTSCDFWFGYLTNLTEISKMKENLNTSKVTNMSEMFLGCQNLQEIDLSGFNTESVTGSATGKPDTYYMNGLYAMFWGCSKLTTLDLSSFNVANSKNFVRMFADCENLKAIFVDNDWTIDQSADSYNMFSGCDNLYGGKGSVAYIEDMPDARFARIDGGAAQPGFFTKKGDPVFVQTKHPYTIIKDGTATFYYGDNKPEGALEFGQYTNKSAITKVVFDESFKDYYPISCASWFSDLTNLTEIIGMDKYLNTSKVKTMNSMFYGCTNIKSLDLSSFSTARLTNTFWMFSHCSNLMTIFVGDGWKRSSGYNDAYMFLDCPRLYGGKGTHCDESSIKYARIDGGYENPGYFTKKGDTPKAPYVIINSGTATFYFDDYYKYENSLNLQSVKLWDNDTRASITKVVFDESFKDYIPNSCQSWFEGLNNLAEISGMNEYLNTSQVANMSNMFKDCKILKTINLSGLNTAKVKNMSGMFYGCSKLKAIFADNSWTTINVSDYADMFGYCPRLYGGKGTHCEESDIKFAIIDGTDGKPGYLTKSGDPVYVSAIPIAYTIVKDGTATLYYGLNNDDDIMLLQNDELWSNELRSSVTKVVFHESFKDYKPKSCYAWFYEFSNLTEITGMKEYLNTSEVTNMAQMFNGCAKLKNIDLSGFDTKKVTTMRGMFNKCSNLRTLDLSTFNTANVTSTYCMFNLCSNLRTIFVDEGWSTASVTEYDKMFSDSPKLYGGKGTHCEESDIKYAIIDGTDGKPGYLTKSGEPAFKVIEPYVEIKDGIATFYYNNAYSNDALPIQSSTSDANWPEDVRNSVTKVVFDKSFKDYKPTRCGYWFNEFRNLTEISGMKEYLNTENVTDMGSMFERCTKLTILDISGFNTEKVKIMRSMFYGCSSLQTIIVGEGWVTSSVTSSAAMFAICRNLYGGKGTAYDQANTGITYAHIDGGEENPGYLTKSGEPIFIPSTPYVILKDGTATFYYDTKKPEDALRPTAYNWSEDVRKSVTKVVFDESYKDYKPTDCNSMFYELSNLTEITGMKENLRTANVTQMHHMFNSCSSLTTLDLSNFITTNLESVYGMFNNCTNLQTIIVGEGWNTSALMNSVMFANCTKLYGGKGTAYTSGKNTVSYAHIDGGAENPGYFTKSGEPVFDPYKPYAIVEDGVATFYSDVSIPEGALKMRTEQDDKNWTAAIRESITKVVFDKSFKGYTPYKLTYWFSSMPNLTELSGMENINTSKLEYMDQMFQFCTNLKSVDFSGFNTAKVTNMSRLFLGCENLAYVLVGENWNTTSVTKSAGMFEDCKNLHGSKGTAYNADYTDATYARIDGGTETPGYLTKAGETIYKILTSIAVTTSPKTEYTEGDNFSTEEGILTLTYNTGETETVNLSEATITGYDKTKLGEQTLKVEYQGIETTLAVTVNIKKALASIEVTLPKTVFAFGENFYTGDGFLTLIYNTGETRKVNLSAATITGYDPYKRGEQTLTITYQGVETTLTVTVGTTTPVSDVANSQDNVKVWSFNSTIYIETAPDTKYTIIDLNGRILKSSTTSSSKEEIRLNQSGIVVVIINNASYKLAL